MGTPSPALYASINILRAIVQLAIGAHSVVVANSPSDLADRVGALSGEASRILIVVSDYPGRDFVQSVLEEGMPFVLCVDRLVRIAHYAIATRKEMTAVMAARFASTGLVNVERLMTSPPGNAVIARPEWNIKSVIGEFCRAYGLDDQDRLDQVMEYLGVSASQAISFDAFAAKACPQDIDVRATLEKQSPLENELIDFLALHYDRIVAGQALTTLEWPTFALLRPEFPDRLTVGAIDLTGPARFIHYGPFLSLPEGVWTIEVAIEVQDCLSDNRVAIETFAEEVLARFETQLPSEGVYGCALRFRVVSAARPIELRVQLLTGAIEGTFLIRRIKLTRVTDE